MIGTTSACALNLFRNAIALEKDDEQVNFMSMRIQALWECSDQDQEVGAKHIDSTEIFQHASRGPIPPLVGGQPGELIHLEDDLLEDTAVLRLRGEKEQVVETEQESSHMEHNDENDTSAIL